MLVMWHEHTNTTPQGQIIDKDVPCITVSEPSFILRCVIFVEVVVIVVSLVWVVKLINLIAAGFLFLFFF